MTSDLEQRLASLGATLELPPAPDLVPTVLARLPERPRRRRPTRRAVAVVFAAMVLLAGGAMAAAPTRHAILRILGLRGVAIERVPHLSPLPAGAGATLGLGQRIPLGHARHAASFTALLPPGSSAVYLDHDLPGGRISVLMGRVLIIEFRGTSTPFIFKVIGPGTRVRFVRVNDGQGVYLSGALHELLFRDQAGMVQSDPVRLAGNVLLWQAGSLTIRIEGTRSLGQAVALARSLR